MIVSVPVEVAVPAGVVIRRTPLVAPVGMMIWIEVADTTRQLVTLIQIGRAHV